jgi:hypothetical protein
MRAAGVLTTASPQCLKWDRRRRVPTLRSPVIATFIVLSIPASRTMGNDVSPEDIANSEPQLQLLAAGWANSTQDRLSANIVTTL